MNKHITVAVTTELPTDLFAAARAVLGAEAAFSDLVAKLNHLGIVASVSWDANAPMDIKVRLPKNSSAGWRTAERLAYVNANYATAPKLSDVVRGVNALPGPSASTSAVCAYAASKRLHRPLNTPGQLKAAHARSFRIAASA